MNQPALFPELAGPALAAAPALLGAVIVATDDAGTVAIRLTEVEAYGGAEDPGSHAYRGPSARNASMFARPGTAYVYRHMGLHYCLNVACRPAGEGAAVLLRAGQVVVGEELARRRRTAARRPDAPPVAACDLARGPARLTQALGVTLADDGTNLLVAGSRLHLLTWAHVTKRWPEAPGPAEDAGRWIETGPRVGVSGAGGESLVYPWRFWLADDPSVSVYRPAPPSRRRQPGHRRVPGRRPGL